jgi:hypothetical protein
MESEQKHPIGVYMLSPLYFYEVFFLVIFCAATGMLAINRLIVKMVEQ